MGAAAKPRWAIVFLMMLTLGVSLGLPAEDVLEAAYDESEALPYEGTPVVSDAPSQAAAPATAASRSAGNRKSTSPCGAAASRVNGNDCDRSSDVRKVALAFLCTLLC